MIYRSFRRFCPVTFLFFCFSSHLSASTGPAFLTLPFDDANIVITYGWFYSANMPHHGIDYAIGSPSVSFPVLAAASGKAVVILDNASNSSGYGNFVYIKHEEGDSSGLPYFTLYAHLESGSWPNSLKVKTIKGLKTDIANGNFADWMPVDRGSRIGSSGETGVAYGIHLHFEPELGGYSLNKTDPYGINNTAGFYPPPSQNCSNALSAAPYLWTQCPPIIPPSGTLVNFSLVTTTSFSGSDFYPCNHNNLTQTLNAVGNFTLDHIDISGSEFNFGAGSGNYFDLENAGGDVIYATSMNQFPSLYQSEDNPSGSGTITYAPVQMPRTFVMRFIPSGWCNFGVSFNIYGEFQPMAGFAMSADESAYGLGTVSATDGSSALSVFAPIGNPIKVNFDATPRSAAPSGATITGWLWTINGSPVATTAIFSQFLSSSASFGQLTTYNVGLVVTDSHGTQSQLAQGTVIARNCLSVCEVAP